LSQPADRVVAPRTESSEKGPGITLVLGGGGFKGMAHVGVLMALEKGGVPVSSIVGTSAGAMMGSAYVQRGSAVRLKEEVLAFVHSDAFQRKGFVGFGGSPQGGNGVSAFMSRLFSGLKRQVALERMFRRSSAFGGAALRFVVHSLVQEGLIEDLPLPVAIAAVDIERGEEVLLTEGDVQSAVTASSSVPGFFPPVERDGRLLMDAGNVNNLPTRAARGLGATRLVAVDLSFGMLDSKTNPSVGMDLLLRAQDISCFHASRRAGDLADVVLCPDLTGRDWLDPTDPAQVIEAGEEAATAALPEIRELLGSTTWSG
jgi:NTE family protein